MCSIDSFVPFFSILTMANAVEDSGETHINTSLRSLKDKAGMNRCAIAWETNMSV